MRAVNQGLLDFNQKPGMIVILVCHRLHYTLVELRMNTIKLLSSVNSLLKVVLSMLYYHHRHLILKHKMSGYFQCFNDWNACPVHPMVPLNIHPVIHRHCDSKA